MLIDKNIKFLHKKLNLSQDEFGLMFELNTGTIAKYISGKALPKLETIQKICDYFEITIDQFVKEDLSKGYITNQNKFANESVKEGLKYIEALEENKMLLKEKNTFLTEKIQFLEEKLINCENEKKRTNAVK